MSRQVVAVLSGGGAKAAAHIGALEVLRSKGIVPTRYVGTSMGAVIAAGFAIGLSGDRILSQLRTIERRDVTALDRTVFLKGVYSRSMLQGERLRGTLGRLLPVHRFSQLILPLTVTAVDLDQSKLVLFGDGGVDAPLVDALYASCSLPVLYPPVEIAGMRLVDGGVWSPLPLEVAGGFPADLVVAIDVGPGFDTEPKVLGSVPALIRSHNDSQFTLMARVTMLELALWKCNPERPRLLYIRPDVYHEDTFAVERVDEYLEAGRKAAKRALEGWNV